MINKKKYPLYFLKEVKNSLKEVNKIAVENSDVIEVVKYEELQIFLKDAAKDSDFEFAVFNPQIIGQSVNFIVQFNPASYQSISIHKGTCNSESVFKFLTYWIKIVREYESLNLSPEEEFLNNYTEEFYEKFEAYDEFEIIDEDADVNPYDLKAQLKIDTFLSNSIDIFKKDEEENKLLIEEASELKKDLPKLTKKATVKRLSKLFARVRQKSLSLFKEFFEEAKKELFKRMIDGTLESVGKYIE